MVQPQPAGALSWAKPSSVGSALLLPAPPSGDTTAPLLLPELPPLLGPMPPEPPPLEAPPLEPLLPLDPLLPLPPPLDPPPLDPELPPLLDPELLLMLPPLLDPELLELELLVPRVPSTEPFGVPMPVGPSHPTPALHWMLPQEPLLPLVMSWNADVFV